MDQRCCPNLAASVEAQAGRRPRSLRQRFDCCSGVVELPASARPRASLSTTQDRNSSGTTMATGELDRLERSRCVQESAGQQRPPCSPSPGLRLLRREQMLPQRSLLTRRHRLPGRPGRRAALQDCQQLIRQLLGSAGCRCAGACRPRRAGR